MTYGAQAMMTLPHSAVFSEAKKFLKFCERAPIIENVSSLCGDSDAPGRHLFCPMESRGAPVHEGDIGSAADERCSTGVPVFRARREPDGASSLFFRGCLLDGGFVVGCDFRIHLDQLDVENQRCLWRHDVASANVPVGQIGGDIEHVASAFLHEL